MLVETNVKHDYVHLFAEDADHERVLVVLDSPTKHFVGKFGLVMYFEQHPYLILFSVEGIIRWNLQEYQGQILVRYATSDESVTLFGQDR